MDLKKNAILIGIGSVAIFSFAGYGIAAGKRNSNIKKNKIAIEKNVENKNLMAKFNGNAFTVSKTEGNYFAELFGIAVKTPGVNPTFTSLTYKVDENFYKRAKQFINIQYQYNEDGKKVGAKNEFKSNFRYLAGANEPAYWEYSQLIKELVEITKKRADFINGISQVNPFMHSVNASANETVFGITSITNPIIDEENKEISFNVQTITKLEMNDKDQGKITLKTFKVTQALTNENNKNKFLVFDEYLKGKGKFELTNEENITINNFDIAKIENDWGSKKPIIKTI